MVKVLHIVSSLGGGGVEKMLFEYYKRINRKEMTFDFIVHGDKKGILEPKVLALGSKIYHVTPKKVSFINNFKEIYKIIKKNKYSVVVVHQNFSSFSSLFAAWICKTKRRIVHSHGYIPGEKLSVQKKVYRFLNKIFSNDFAACSPEAATWLYGSKDDVTIIYNAIDTEEFEFNSEARKVYRKKLGIDDDDVCLLQVGRFSEEKNHKFSLEILEKINSKKYKLVFAGDGDAEEDIKKTAKQKHVDDQTLFLGCVDNIGNIMCAGDILLFPSKNEGFGIVAIEAQVSGMHVLASSAVPRSTKISENIEYISVNDKNMWIKKIKDFAINVNRKSVSTEKFSTKIQSKIYEEYLKNGEN